MRRARIDPRALALAMACALAGAASAQDRIAGGDARRDAGAEDGRGLRIGTVLVRPRLDARAIYDDNIFRTARRKTGSAILRLGAAVEAKTDWRRHALGLDAGVSAGAYASSSADDYLDAHLTAEAVLDITRALRARVRAGVARGHEARGGDDAQASLAAPVITRRAFAELTGQIAPGRIRLQPQLRVERLDFADQRFTAGGVSDQDDRDRTRLTLGLKAIYAAPGALRYVLEGDVARIDYDRARDRNGRNRDATQFRMLAGVRLAPRGPLTGGLAAGYQRRDFTSSALRDFSGPVVEARIDWRPSRLWEVNLLARRTVEETTVAGASSARVDRAELRAAFEARRFVRLTAEAAMERRRFKGVGRVDRTLVIGAGVEWAARRGSTVSFGLRHIDENSTAAGEDAQVNAAWLGLVHEF